MSALAAYRSLLRSARIAFEGDIPVLTAARQEMRNKFELNRNSAPEQATAQITEANEVAKFLRENVVQGVKEGEDDRYRLRIHEYTERGDNESIKKAGKKLREGGGTLNVGMGGGGGCCGGAGAAARQ